MIGFEFKNLTKDILVVFAMSFYINDASSLEFDNKLSNTQIQDDYVTFWEKEAHKLNWFQTLTKKKIANFMCKGMDEMPSISSRQNSLFKQTKSFEKAIYKNTTIDSDFIEFNEDSLNKGGKKLLSNVEMELVWKN